MHTAAAAASTTSGSACLGNSDSDSGKFGAELALAPPALAQGRLPVRESRKTEAGKGRNPGPAGLAEGIHTHHTGSHMDWRTDSRTAAELLTGCYALDASPCPCGEVPSLVGFAVVAALVEAAVAVDAAGGGGEARHRGIHSHTSHFVHPGMAAANTDNSSVFSIG